MQKQKAHSKLVGACVYVWSADSQGQIVASLPIEGCMAFRLVSVRLRRRQRRTLLGLRHWFEELRDIPDIADKRSNLSCAMMLHMDY